ncbi:MAG TPA: metal-sensing transcriptional repressor [Pseudomonadales bacterium]|nr:metal-sensing transcriptional repressor [Pseudomonadales bacterium]
MKMPVNPDHKSAMKKRLARIEGQLRGVQKLIESDADCEQVIQQMTASRRALDRAFYELLACVIENNVVANSADENSERTMAEIRNLLSKYA